MRDDEVGFTISIEVQPRQCASHMIAAEIVGRIANLHQLKMISQIREHLRRLLKRPTRFTRVVNMPIGNDQIELTIVVIAETAYGLEISTNCFFAAFGAQRAPQTIGTCHTGVGGRVVASGSPAVLVPGLNRIGDKLHGAVRHQHMGASLVTTGHGIDARRMTPASERAVAVRWTNRIDVAIDATSIRPTTTTHVVQTRFKDR